MSKYFVYILRCSDQTLYTGITTDLNRRVSEHNSQKLGAKYTRGRRPVELIYSEAFPDRSSATKTEAAIKILTLENKLRLVDNQQYSAKSH